MGISLGAIRFIYALLGCMKQNKYEGVVLNIVESFGVPCESIAPRIRWCKSGPRILEELLRNPIIPDETCSPKGK